MTVEWRTHYQEVDGRRAQCQLLVAEGHTPTLERCSVGEKAAGLARLSRVQSSVHDVPIDAEIGFSGRYGAGSGKRCIEAHAPTASGVVGI